MKIGLASTDFEPECGPLPLKLIFEKIRDFGYDCVQLSLSSIQESNFIPDGNFDIPPEIPTELPGEILRLGKEYGVSISALNGTYNTAHPDETIRQEGLRRFALLAKAAKEMDVPAITLCSGSRCPQDMWAPHPDNDSLNAFRDMLESMKALTEIAESNGLSLAIEPEASNIINTAEKANAILFLVGSPRLGMIMDAANLFHVGEAKQSNVAPRLNHAFSLFGSRIILAHGKDIMEGPGISFCAAGEGIVDFRLMKQLLNDYSYTGDMIVHGVYNQEKMAAVCTQMREIFG